MIIYVRSDLTDMLPTGLQEYEAMFEYMTQAERKELHDWVNAGNQVICNPWYMAGEDGRPLDYITASRIVDDMVTNTEDYGIGCKPVPCDHDEDDEIPF